VLTAIVVEVYAFDPVLERRNVRFEIAQSIVVFLTTLHVRDWNDSIVEDPTNEAIIGLFIWNQRVRRAAEYLRM
jgi:hypothetical protein